MNYRARLDENCPAPPDEALRVAQDSLDEARSGFWAEHARRNERLVARLKIALAIVGILLSCLMVVYYAHATQTSDWQSVLTRTSSGTYVNTAKGATPEAALQACHALVPTAASVRTQYACSPPRRVYIVTPNPTCPAAPAP